MKLTHEEADKLVYAATLDCVCNPFLRFGQALWNMLPHNAVQDNSGGELDFFYWTDKQKVLQAFYSHYVECYHHS